MNKQQWRQLCEQKLGTPYVWGTSGPDAFDASGFVWWALSAINLDPPGDQSAAGLYRRFSNGRSSVVPVDAADVGDLVFFGTDESVTHVGLAWGNAEMLEAGGGGRDTTSEAIAQTRKAQVRIRAIARRNDLIAVLRPHAMPWLKADNIPVAESPESAVCHEGRYLDAPPLAEWLDDGRHMRLKRAFGYVDSAGREWPVPSETVVDGASIPKVVWSLIGGPFEGLYRNASIVHDYYCDVRSRAWQETHRVFLDGMLCSGVNTVQAKIMYYAVYRFGPRWTMAAVPVVEAFATAPAPSYVSTPLPMQVYDSASFEMDADLIAAADPAASEIEAMADARDEGQSHPSATLVMTPQAAAEGGLPFAQLKPRYEELYASCTIRPERAGEVAWHLKKLQQNRPRYEAVSTATGVPWWFIGVVHALETSFSFVAHLHNGDPLSARTIHVPKNRPAAWNPPNDWETSAIDALAQKNFVGLADWSVAAALYRWESYNGFGYWNLGINSPYLWSYSNHYTKGKYVADHVYDPEKVSRQCGAAAMLKALEKAGLA